MKKLLLAAILAGSALAAHAEGAYLGLDAVYNRYDAGSSVAAITAIPGVVSTSSTSGNKLGYKVLAGYNFNPIWSVEGGYADFGSPNYTFSVTPATFGVKVDSTAWYLAGKASTDLNKEFSLYGKLGVARTRISATVSGTATATTGVGSSNNTSVYAAVGGQYNISKEVSWVLELERFGKPEDGGTKGNALSTGIRFNFW